MTSDRTHPSNGWVFFSRPFSCRFRYSSGTLSLPHHHRGFAMSSNLFIPSRRTFLNSSLAMGAGFWTVPGLFAEELVKTPRQTEGPFYPDKLPLDTDNDLLIVNDKLTPAVGEVTHLTGKILDAKGNPMSGALVEIWQCDANGAYFHSKSDNGGKRDANFQGYGRFTTSKTGEYYFRTIKPVPYPGRTP